MSEQVIVEDEIVTVVSVGTQGPPGPGLANTDALPEGDDNLYYTEDRVAANTSVSANTAARHTHANKALLDTYDQTNANLADAVTKKHTHSNQAVLDATTASFAGTDETKLDGIAAGATANSTDAQLRDRSTHTGTQSADTITDGTTNHVFTAADDTKLAGIEAGAEVNDVTAVHGRTGAVSAQAGDYTATQVTNTPAGNIAATTVQAAINELDTEKAATSHTHAQSDVTGLSSALTAKEDTANKGTAGGYASLDGTGKVPSAQLPGFVDDVIEAANFAALPGRCSVRRFTPSRRAASPVETSFSASESRDFERCGLPVG